MQYDIIYREGFGAVVHKERSDSGTIITRYAGGMIRKDYPNGKTGLFQGKPVKTLSGGVTGNLGGIGGGTSSSSLGR